MLLDAFVTLKGEGNPLGEERLGFRQGTPGTEAEAALEGTAALTARPRQAERAQVPGETTDLISSVRQLPRKRMVMKREERKVRMGEKQTATRLGVQFFHTTHMHVK